MYSPPPFNDRTEGQKVLIGAVIPALVGGLAGVLVGVSAVAYWVVAILAGAGAFLSGFEHSDGWDQSFERLVAQIMGAFRPGTDRGWIATLDGRRAGCVLYVRQDARTAKLRTLLVEPEARGHGLGARLVQAVIDHARDNGHETLALWTNDVLSAARRIYERAGFRLETEAPHHAFGHDLVEQTWSLTL